MNMIKLISFNVNEDLKAFLETCKPESLTQAQDHLRIADELNADFANTLNYNAGFLKLNEEEKSHSELWDNLSLAEKKESIYRGKYWIEISKLKTKEELDEFIKKEQELINQSMDSENTKEAIEFLYSNPALHKVSKFFDSLISLDLFEDEQPLIKLTRIKEMIVKLNSLLDAQINLEKEWKEKPSEMIKDMFKEERKGVNIELYKQEPVFVDKEFISLLNKKELVSNKQLIKMNDREKLFALLSI